MLKIRYADLAVTVILLAIGIAQLIGGYTMDRLEIRQIHPTSIPGLLPMILGLAITIAAGLQLFAMLRLRRENGDANPDEWIERAEFLRVCGLIIICAAYALFLVGRIPFWPASSLFVVSFILVFELSSGMSRRLLYKTIVRAVVIAVLFGGALSLLFEKLFLVRLP